MYDATGSIRGERTLCGTEGSLRFRNHKGGAAPIKVVVGEKIKDLQWPEGGPAEGEWWNRGALVEMDQGQALIHRPDFQGIMRSRSRLEAAWAFKLIEGEGDGVCRAARFRTVEDARRWLLA